MVVQYEELFHLNAVKKMIDDVLREVKEWIFEQIDLTLFST